MLKIGLLTF
jgi:hypothetical protein